MNAQTNAINQGYNVVTRYPRADYVCIDAEEARLAFGDRSAPLTDVIDELAGRLETRLFTVTRGPEGSMVRDAEGEVVTMQEIFHFERHGVDKDGQVLGELVPTGIRPHFAKRLKLAGIELPAHLFERRERAAV